jgi:sn-glycerol 3-phosphate transport system substrate-binding protein
MENFSAWHDIPMATRANGFEGLDAVMKYDTGDQVKHFQALADWQKDGIFVYGGRTNKGNALFSSGEVGMYTESSAGYAGFKANAKFEFGTSMLPYWPNIGNPPQNTIIGGASLWVMAGHPDKEYEAVAKFFSYLSSPEVQADWHQFSGYLPITEAAYNLTKSQGFYEKNPGTETSLKQMLLNDPTPNSRGIRLGNFPQIRDIHYEEFEAIFNGDKTAQQGLKDAAERANRLLREFEKANK